jgi:predicted acetyltransferase
VFRASAPGAEIELHPPGEQRYNQDMDLPIRPVTADELPGFLHAEEISFGERATPASIEDLSKIFEPDRTLAVHDGERIVATTAAFSFEVTVPGNRQLPAAGVTAVGVHATHRRRGLLTRLMARQLDDVAERGEPLAILGSSEGGIYGRYGYGPATFYSKVEVEKVKAQLTGEPEPGRLVLLDKAEAKKLIPPIYDRVRRQTPGAISRSDAWWPGLIDDPEHRREGSGERFDVIHERVPGEVDGYVSYRFSHARESGRRRNVLLVLEVYGLDDQVRTALWRYVLGVDLVDVVHAYCAVDEPIGWRLTDLRQWRTVHTGDMLWARVLDVPVALSARTYEVGDRLVLRVEDPFRPQSGGTFELEGGPDGAACRPVTAEPDLVLGASQLGSAYLGGVRLATLARAGLVTEVTPGALGRADRMFVTPRAPWCDTDF